MSNQPGYVLSPLENQVAGTDSTRLNNYHDPRGVFNNGRFEKNTIVNMVMPDIRPYGVDQQPGNLSPLNSNRLKNDDIEGSKPNACGHARRF